MTQSVYVPIVSSVAGGVLTGQNWQQAGVAIGAYYLDDLLMKPGRAILEKIGALTAYSGGWGAVVLNCSRLRFNTEGEASLTSVYNGEKIKVNLTQWLSLIASLMPDYLVLPPHLNEEILIRLNAFTFLKKIFVPAQYYKTPDYSHSDSVPADSIDSSAAQASIIKSQSFDDNRLAFYHVLSEGCDWLTFLSKLGQVSYVIGNFTQEQYHQLASLSLQFIESESPMLEAIRGTVYGSDEILRLTEPQYEHQHLPIDEKCQCNTCQLSLTRAYLHHLYQQTPLLCYRLLAIHNVISYCNRGFGV